MAYLVVGWMLSVAAGLVVVLFSFGMLFATDSCGTGRDDPAVCHPAVWLAVVAMPWVGLLALIQSTFYGARRARRAPGNPWPWLAVGAAVYLVFGTAAIVMLQS